MAKRKYQKEISDEELLRAVEDIESKMADEMSDRELLRAVKRIKHRSLNSIFGPWGHVDVARKMWLQNNDLQHAWKNYATLTRW